MFAAFVATFTMRLSVATGKTYLPIGSVPSAGQAKTLSNPKKKNQLMAEDLCREAGFMLPQSSNTRSFLESIKTYPGIPVDAVESLLKNIEFNEKMEEKKMEKWKCTVCGYIHEGDRKSVV